MGDLEARLAEREEQLVQAAAYGTQLLEENARLREQYEQLLSAAQQAENLSLAQGQNAGDSSAQVEPPSLNRQRADTQQIAQEANLRREVESLTGEVERLSAALQAVADARDSWQTKHSDLGNRLALAEGEVNRARAELVQVQKQLEVTSAESDSLRERLGPLLDAESARAKEAAKASQSEQSLASQKVSALEKRLQAAEDALRFNEAKLREAEEVASRVQEVEERNDHLLQQQRETNDFLDQARVAAQQLREELEERAHDGGGSLADELGLGGEGGSAVSPERAAELDAEAARKQRLLDELNQKLFYAECTIKGLDMTMEQLNDQLRAGATRQGWLLRRGRAGVWRRKFFFLKADRMYFCDSPSSEFEGMILLSRAQVAAVGRAEQKGFFDSLFGSASPGALHKWLFEISTPERSIVLEAATQQDRNEWVRDINEKIEALAQVAALEIARREAKANLAASRQSRRPRSRADTSRPERMHNAVSDSGQDASGQLPPSAGRTTAVASTRSRPRTNSEHDMKINAAAEQSRQRSALQAAERDDKVVREADPLGVDSRESHVKHSPPPSPTQTRVRDKQLRDALVTPTATSRTAPVLAEVASRHHAGSASQPGRPFEISQLGALLQHSDDEDEDH